MPYNISISPWASGTQPVAGNPNSPNLGICLLKQYANLAFNGTLISQVELFVPPSQDGVSPGARLSTFDIDVLTAFNSSSSATLSIGSTSGGTDYVSGINVKNTGRAAITYTAAQLAAMSNQNITGGLALIPGPIFITITSVGQPTAGYVTVAMTYAQLSTPN